MPQPSHVDEMELRDFIRMLAPYKWKILVATLLTTVLFTTAAFIKTPVYRVSIVLAPVSADRGLGSLSSVLGQLGGLASLAGIGVGSGNANVEEALAVLRSREFTERFIEENNLLPQLYPKKWDGLNHRWKVPPEKVPTLARASKYFGKGIRSITQDKKTGLVTVGIDWRDPQKAAEWCHLLVVRLNNEMRQRALTNADRYIEYLQKEAIVTPTVEAREAINRLLEAQIKQRMVATVTSEYAFRVVDRGMPPEEDDFIRPQRPVWSLSGLLIGLVVSVLIAFVRSYVLSSKRLSE